MHKLTSVLLLAFALQSANLGATVRYVLSGTVGSGASWADASGDLRATLARARAGDEVWVGPGTFAPTTCGPCTRADKLVSFVLPKGVRLRGGFRGTESDTSQRVPTAAATVLSGRISRAGAGDVDAFTILTVTDPTAGTLLERLNFLGGTAVEDGHGLSDPIVSGAQVDVMFSAGVSGGELSVVGCAFAGGRSLGYGGAVYVNADDGGRSRVVFRECRFDDNASETGGGAVYVSAQRGGHDLSAFEGCDFRQNTAGAEGGGALILSGAEGGRVTARVIDCEFVANRSPTGNGGAVRVVAIRGAAGAAFAKTRFEGNAAIFGGAFDFDARFGGVGSPDFREVAFVGNRGDAGGGGFYSDTNGGGSSDPSFERCVFRANRCEGSGGALYFNAFEGRSLPRLTDCRIEENTVGLYGGGIYNFGRGGVLRPTLINTVIARNRASSAGGIYALGSERGDASATIINCAFVNNRAAVGGALYSNANDQEGRSAPTVINTIFQGNQAPTGHTLRNVYGRPTLAYCSFDRPDCEALRSGVGAQQTCGPGNLFGVPDVFVDTATGDYRLRADARVVDAGSADTLLARGTYYDLDSNARFRGATVDMGPIELASSPLNWSVKASRVDSVACVGEAIRLSATLSAAFPVTTAWSFGESRLSTELATSVQASPTAGTRTYVITAAAYGERLRDSITVTVLPTRPTSLAIDDTALRDTLIVGRAYRVATNRTPARPDDVVVWRTASGGTLATADVLDFVPPAVGRDSLLAEVIHGGTCPSPRVRTAAVAFVAKLLDTGLTEAGGAATCWVTPSPAGDVLVVGGLPAKPATIVVLDIMGRPVSRRVTDGEARVELAVGALAAGVYVVAVEINGGGVARVFVRK